MATFIPMKIMASHPFKFMLKEEWLGILKKKGEKHSNSCGEKNG